MSDEWTVESEAPQKKGGLPTWFWWTCGTGCLLAVLIAVTLSLFGFFAFRKMADPEQVKLKLVDVLPCDQWPADYKPRGGGWGVEQYFITWPDQLGLAIVYKVSGKGDLSALLDPDSLQNKFGLKNRLEGEMELQGRTAKTMRYEDVAGQDHLRVDITGEVPPYSMLDVSVAEDADAEETARRFLEPFDIWRGEG